MMCMYKNKIPLSSTYWEYLFFLSSGNLINGKILPTHYLFINANYNETFQFIKSLSYCVYNFIQKKICNRYIAIVTVDNLIIIIIIIISILSLNF